MISFQKKQSMESELLEYYRCYMENQRFGTLRQILILT